jgi:hypothetical protein
MLAPIINMLDDAQGLHLYYYLVLGVLVVLTALALTCLRASCTTLCDV